MPFVVDASIAASWAFSDESSPDAAAALAALGRDTAWVPALWWFEIRNALVVNERRGRLTPATTAEFLRRLSHLRITEKRDPNESEILRLTRTYRLTVYDAAYLELAQGNEVPLATLDKALKDAAQAEGVPLLGPTSSI
ncbi:MAG TPA: type II toxin-antitoxin system VapC family toxin [Acidobacteriaceae bacterium]